MSLEESGRTSCFDDKAELFSSPISLGRIGEITGRNIKNRPTVAVVLATYCEAENIENLIREIKRLGFNSLIIVIDDSSPDGTIDLVKKLQEEYDNVILCVRPTKLGLGDAITDGFRLILSIKERPNYIVTMDADYSHNPQDILRLMNASKCGYDIVIGSRYCEGGETVGWGPIRWLTSHVANIVASATIRTTIHDCTSGLRCYSMRYVKTVLHDLHSQTYEIQIETLRQAKLKGFSVREIPISFTNRKRGKSKLTKTEFKTFLSYILKNVFGGAR